MIKLMEEQKFAEQERLRKAIEQADKDREEELKRKEEEEKLRVEVSTVNYIETDNILCEDDIFQSKPNYYLALSAHIASSTK